MSAASVVLVLELAGLYVFATSGALLAVQKGFDVVGIVILAFLTALGGGILRDLIIGDTPPAAFTDIAYLIIPLVAAAVTFFAHPVVQRLSFPVLVFDAAGLGLFCVTGTLKALAFGLGPMQAVLLGITTAVGGGVLRDITARETPALVQVGTDLYAIPAAAGSALVAAAHRTDLPIAVVATSAAVFVFGLRIVAMLRHWRAPRAWRTHRSGAAGPSLDPVENEDQGEADEVSQVLMPNGPPATPEDSAQLLELYKLMVQSSEALVARRLGTNTFFLAVNAALVTGIGLFVRQGANVRSHGLAIAILCLAGFLVAAGWRTLLTSFGRLNAGKFAVIFRLEKVLPAAIFEAEWAALNQDTGRNRYRTFTASERRLPAIFMAIYGFAFVTGLAIGFDWLPLR